MATIGGTTVSTDKFALFLGELLSPRRGNGGWVRPMDLAKAAGVSRATAYRYLSAIEASGMVLIERDPCYPNRHHEWRGVRSLHVLTRRDPAPHHRTPTGATHVHQ